MRVKFARHNIVVFVWLCVFLGLNTARCIAQFPIVVNEKARQPFARVFVINDSLQLTVSDPPAWAGKSASMSLIGSSGTVAVRGFERSLVATAVSESGVSILERSGFGFMLSVYGSDSLSLISKHVLDSIPLRDVQLTRTGSFTQVHGDNTFIIVSDQAGILLHLENIVCGDIAVAETSADNQAVYASIVRRRGVNYELLTGAIGEFATKSLSLQEPAELYTTGEKTYILESRNGYAVLTVIDGSGTNALIVDSPIGMLVRDTHAPHIAVFTSNGPSARSIEFVSYSNGEFTSQTVDAPESSGKISAFFLVDSSLVLAQTGTESWLVSIDDVAGVLPTATQSILDVQIQSNVLTINGQNDNVVYTLTEDSWWRFKDIQDRYLLPMVFLIVVLIAWRFWSLARKRRHVLRSLYNVDGADPFVFVSANLNVEEMNPAARSWLGIDDSVPLGDMIHVYVPQSYSELLHIVEQTLVSSHEMQSRISVEQQGIKHEMLLRSFCVTGLFGRLTGVVITATDITEELAQRQMQNWAQLAHDMQTSLSIIKLNAQQIATQTGQTNLQEKILLQSNVLISRVKDLVTLGRASSDELLDIREMCKRVASEFDEQLFREITFAFELKACKVSGDKPKLERALRNAIENGIRAMEGRPGTIRLACHTKGGMVAIEVEDDGAGMDAITQEQMMQPHFSGFQSMGGSGMGTIIMQHVMKLHQGALQVESEKGKGTIVRFLLPAPKREI